MMLWGSQWGQLWANFDMAQIINTSTQTHICTSSSSSRTSSSAGSSINS
jgi:hypothetical protein